MDVPDLTAVDRLDAAALLGILSERYASDSVYTYIGPILVALNPLKQLPIYGEAEAARYREASSRSDVPPHVYRIAHEAFSEMVDERMNQSVVVSGESGAGKTETTKHIVRMVSWASAHALGLAAGGAGSVGAALEAKLLATNPILEALGNCRTLRNDNSSRFGKFIRLQCSGAGAITGCTLDTYLLEKSRVAAPGPGERNFHIFYQLLAGGVPSLRPELQRPLGGSSPSASGFTFLNAEGAVHTIDGVDDKAAFEETRLALRAVGLADADVALVLELVCALLLIGNVQFAHGEAAGSDGQAGAVLASQAASDALASAATALACNAADIESGMCSRRLRAGTEWVTKRHSVAEANSARDALAKALYAGLFDALVKRVNSSLGGGKKKKEEERVGASSAFFGVLDIFGFENFASNSLEQLCINFANEKLQGHFNAVVFKAALADYAKEGVHVPADLPFTDNQAVIEAIEAKPNGLVWLLQDTCSFAKATDDSFADSVEEKLKGSAALAKQKGGKNATAKRSFTLRHYAGDVTYEVAGFLHKNKDPLHEDLSVAITESKRPLVAALLSSASGGAQGGKGFKGVLSKFYQQLDALVRQLCTSKCTFVRCIKPNPSMRAGEVSSPYVLEQLAACGVLEAIAITRSGYPDRLLCAELAPQFGMLIHPDTVPQGLQTDDAAARAICERIFAAAGLKRGAHYELGHRKAFFRAGTFSLLREARRKRTLAYATALQAAGRRMLAVRKRKSLAEAALAAAAEKKHAHKAAARKEAEARALADRAAAEAASAAIDAAPLGADADAAAEAAALEARKEKWAELDQLRNPNSELASARAKLKKVPKRKGQPASGEDENGGGSGAAPNGATAARAGGAARGGMGHSKTYGVLDTRVPVKPSAAHVIQADDQDIGTEDDNIGTDGVALPKTALPTQLPRPSSLRTEVDEMSPDVLDYARYLGMDPDDPVDAGLLWIAKEALFAAVPEPWLESVDMRGHLYYVNDVTGQSLREHPLDEYYRQMVFQHRGQWGKAYWTPGTAAAQHKDAHNRRRTEFDYYTQAGYYQNTEEMAEAFAFDDLPAVPGAAAGGVGSGLQPLLPNLQARLVVDSTMPGVIARSHAGQSIREEALPLPMSPFGALPLSRVLTEPAGRFAMVQCYVKREHDRSGLRYDLYLELPPYHALYCMSARKVKASRKSLFRIATDKHGTDVGNAGYLGKLKATDVGGLSWTLYTPGLSPRKAAGGAHKSRKSGASSAAGDGKEAGKDDDDDDGDELRAETLALEFQRSILGSGGPTQLTAALPAEMEEGGRIVVRPRVKEETLSERLKSARKSGLVVMSNKLPVWNEQLQSYTLEYNGRATEPSVKNIQLVESQDSPDIKFQLGKVGADRFNVDYKRPYSALQAFAIAVAVFDDKLLCSPAPPMLRSALTLRDKLLHRNG